MKFQPSKGGLRVAFVTDRSAPFVASDLGRAPDAVIAIIGDDDHAPTGPGGWQCAQAVAEWSYGAVIHAASASAETYQEAVRRARLIGRMVLVETATEHAEAWAELFRGKPALMVLPHGGVHPVAPSPGIVH